MSNGGRTQYRWRKWPCRYVKQYYDIQIVGKDVIKHCWPNAETFHAPDGTVYSSEQVRRIMKSREQS